MNKSIILFVLYIILAVITLCQKPWTSTYVGVKIDTSFKQTQNSEEGDLVIYQWKKNKNWINFSIATKEYFHSIVPSSEDLLRDYWRAFYPDAPIDWTEFNLSGQDVSNIKVNELAFSERVKINFIKVGVRKAKKLIAGDMYLMVGLKENHPFYINFQVEEDMDTKQLMSFLKSKFCFR
ncbi:MAG: hypothetical protein KC646_02070 [Candidatus Cloacimonetes bacterium]|nr:hypothetical protein [Candidatus Cloacimonadota bacterium]